MACGTCGTCGTIVAGVIGLTKAAVGYDAPDEAAVAARIDVCRACPHSEKRGPTGITSLSRCGLCKCFIGAKARVRSEVCPDGRWPT
jgi:hypothetical protein